MVITPEREFGAFFASVRTRCCFSLANVAQATYVSRGWINNIEAGRRWPTREWVRQADDAMAARGELVAAWDDAENERAQNEKLKKMVDQSARESRLLLAIEADAVDLDGVNEVVAELAISYLFSPARPMLEQAVALRGELVRRLTNGTVGPKSIRDLYVALSRISGIISYATLDLGDAEAAMLHGEAAWKTGYLAGHDGLCAWSRGTQSLISRFGGDWKRADYFIHDGLRFAGAGTSKVRLVCGGAQCAANLGNLELSTRLIQQAKRLRETAGTDEVEGLFGFSPAKQSYYSASSLMWLPDTYALNIAVDSAIDAIDIWKRETYEQRSLDDEALAHVYLATARMKLRDVDGAMFALQPVLRLPEDRQISWIGKRMGELSQVLDDKYFRNSPQANAVRDELRAFGT